MAMTKQEAAKLFERAICLLNEKGWVRGNYIVCRGTDEIQAMCAVGALRVAAAGTLDPVEYNVRKTDGAVREALFLAGSSNNTEIEFNDGPYGTKAGVIARFQGYAQKLRAGD